MDIISKVVPYIPIELAAIFGNPFIIPLCMTKNITAVINIVIPNDFHSNLYFLK